jgi:hypothetical protein
MRNEDFPEALPPRFDTRPSELRLYNPPAPSRGILGPVVDMLQSESTTVLHPFWDARILCRLPTGQIYYDSQLAVDTDGSRFAARDATGQARTAWQPGGHAIDADAVPYFSVNIPAFRDRRLGLRKGDLAAVVYGGALAFAVLADVGGRRLGEGSLALHRALGHERVVHRGTSAERFIDDGIPRGVITIVFPGSGASAGTARATAESIVWRGASLWWALVLKGQKGGFPINDQPYG